MTDEKEMMARAEALVPVLAGRRAATYVDRRLSDATIADLAAAGMFKILQPRRLGGLELPYGAQTPISAVLAKGCGAAGWVVSVVATHHWMLGKFHPKAQEDIWGENPDAIACSAFGFARQTTTPVDGGFEVEGRWLYSSGSHAAQWAMIALAVPRKDGPPLRYFALVPRGDFAVQDNWHSLALRGSGSNDIIVNKTFVPAHRAVSFEDLDRIDSPGAAVNPGAAYRLPCFNVFNLTAVGPVLGLARAALEVFVADLKSRRNVMGSKITEFQNIRMRAAESAVEIDAASAIAESHIAQLRALADAGTAPERGYLLQLQRDCAYAGKLCQTAVTRLADALGAGGLADTNPVHLALADIKGACAHITMTWDANSVPYGKYLFGIEHKGLI